MKTQVEARWKRRKDQRTAEIMAAALECFKERGFSATKLDEVAARAVDVEHVVFGVFGPLLMTLIWKHTFEVHAGKPLDARAICRAHLDLLLHGLMKRTDRPDKNSAPSSLSSNLSTSLSTNQFRSLS